jgi:hypothetical protein
LDTIPLAPIEYMQFDPALWRLLQQISEVGPRLGPVHLSKIDIADGLYCIWISSDNVPKLGIMFTGASGDEPLIGFPLVLPMGWMQHPHLFTAVAETVTDLDLHVQAQPIIGNYAAEMCNEGTYTFQPGETIDVYDD